MGSISDTMVRAPAAFMDIAEPLPTSPKPPIQAVLPAIMTSVPRMIPSGSEWRQPYTLSNLDFVTESFTLMAGKSRVPAAVISYNRLTPVVVSSDTPRMLAAILVYLSGLLGIDSFSNASTILYSTLSVVSGSGRVFFSAYSFSNLTPSWMSKVASPPSSTMRSHPGTPFSQVSAFSVHHQYSSRVSPFHAKTAAESRATADAAWSWVEKMLQEHQRTLAPSAVSVSIRTAV
mmetsp:Transcript_71/g.126  ORF Transcript_71/g.126 Transcript_71/m.126 type:complete len:232 (-) Transcript_71:328-1023(-)